MVSSGRKKSSLALRYLGSKNQTCDPQKLNESFYLPINLSCKPSPIIVCNNNIEDLSIMPPQFSTRASNVFVNNMSEVVFNFFLSSLEKTNICMRTLCCLITFVDCIYFESDHKQALLIYSCGFLNVLSVNTFMCLKQYASDMFPRIESVKTVAYLIFVESVCDKLVLFCETISYPFHSDPSYPSYPFHSGKVLIKPKFKERLIIHVLRIFNFFRCSASPDR